jgi:hypothetical protein
MVSCAFFVRRFNWLLAKLAKTRLTLQEILISTSKLSHLDPTTWLNKRN